MKHLLLLVSTLMSCSCLGIIRSITAASPNIIVFYTDDHGYADLGVHGIVDDIKTPHTDALARSGVLARHGYSTAPQCVPSRAGLLSGRFQSRFGLESNPDPLDGFNRQTTIAQRLQAAGYATAQFGKWHLGPTQEITRHGFDHVFAQNVQRPFTANITLDGQDRPLGDLLPERYHVDGCSQAAAALIERYQDRPFFLYIAYRAPHVPLDAPPKYLKRFPGKMPERRRQALAMISAMDDGVGRITETLKEHGLTEQTLIFFISDNGAPLKIHKTDLPGGGPGWDGSLNDPLNGEKGMLAEGGIHVPFIISWPGTIPADQVYDHPVSALDVAATAAEIANIETKPDQLDGVNLIPHLTGKIDAPPHPFLAWRWIAQSAIREGDWKLLRGGQREYLFNLAEDLEETNNRMVQHPEIADRLRRKLTTWCDQLAPPGLTNGTMSETWQRYFDHYLDGIPSPPPKVTAKTEADATSWIVRNGILREQDGILTLTPETNTGRKLPFLTRSGLNLPAPMTARIEIKTNVSGQAAIAWRVAGEKDFAPANRVAFAVAATSDFVSHEIAIPADANIIHLRVHLPIGVSQIRQLALEPPPR